MAEGRKEEEAPYPAWTATVEEVAQHHGVDTSTGLTQAQIDSKRARFGYNELEKEPGKSLFALVLEQFDDMLVKVINHRQSQQCATSASRQYNLTCGQSVSTYMANSLLSPQH